MQGILNDRSSRYDVGDGHNDRDGWTKTFSIGGESVSTPGWSKGKSFPQSTSSKNFLPFDRLCAVRKFLQSTFFGEQSSKTTFGWFFKKRFRESPQREPEKNRSAFMDDGMGTILSSGS